MSVNELPAAELLESLRRIHARTRTAVLEACAEQTLEELVGEAASAAGDTIYAIDRVAEEAYLTAITKEVASRCPVVLIGEGVTDGKVVLPRGAAEQDAAWRVIVDPIDGTRSLMFQKRSAWIVSGAAPNRGSNCSLSQIEVALQSELPTLKQNLCDEYWAQRGQGAQACRLNLATSSVSPLEITPTAARDVTHGFLTVCSYFAGGRDVLGQLVDDLNRELLTGSDTTAPRMFEDQYGSTAGQIAGLMMGQDRVVIDVRPLLQPLLDRRGEAMPHCCHPYDLSAMLVAEAAGVLLASPDGTTLDAPLDTETNVAWVGYANGALRDRVEPVLQRLLHDRLK